jgi:hypothetical protein
VAVRNNIFENLYLGTGGNNFFGNTVTPPNANLIATLVDTGVANPNYDPALPISDANTVNIWKAIISNDGSALDGFDNY